MSRSVFARAHQAGEATPGISSQWYLRANRWDLCAQSNIASYKLEKPCAKWLFLLYLLFACLYIIDLFIYLFICLFVCLDSLRLVHIPCQFWGSGASKAQGKRSIKIAPDPFAVDILHHPRIWRPIGIGAAKVHHGDDLRGSPKAGYATHHWHHLVHGNEVTKQPRSVQGFEPRRLQALPVMQKGLLKCWWVGVLKLAVLHHDRPLCWSLSFLGPLSYTKPLDSPEHPMISSIPSIFDITIHPVSVQSAEEEYYVQSRACHQRPVWHQGCLANDSVIQHSVGQPKCTQTNIACGPIQCKIAKGTRQEF